MPGAARRKFLCGTSTLYRTELRDAAHAMAVAHPRELAAAETVTLLTASRDVAHSHLPTLASELTG